MVILTQDEVKRMASQNSNKKNDHVPITVQKIQSIGGGRYRVKIAQTKENLVNMTIDGRKYKVLRNLGRGRYVAVKGERADDATDTHSQAQI